MNLNIKETLKCIIPKTTRAFLRIGIENINYLLKINQLKKTKKRVAIIFGTPIHENLGDHLITLSEIEFLKEYSNFEEFVEIPKQVYWIYKKRIVNAIKQNMTIFVNGGGWLGDLWAEDNEFMQEIIQIFCKNKIIIFPQTVFYNNNVSNDEIKKDLDIYNKCEELIICAREERSYDLFNHYINNCKVFLLPDIALFYNNFSPKHEYSDINNIVGICFRDDIEKNISNELKNDVIKELKKHDLVIKKVSTMYKNEVPRRKRKRIIYSSLNEFCKCKLIITDRLHGMIFSVITDTPCIAFDNKTHKVSGVYNKWLKNKNNLFLVEDFDEKTFCNYVNKIDNIKFGNELNFCFDKLKDELINGKD